MQVLLVLRCGEASGSGDGHATRGPAGAEGAANSGRAFVVVSMARLVRWGGCRAVLARILG